MYFILRCPKCYTYRAGQDKHKSWKCYKCNYSMNRKNTRVQAKPNNIKEVTEIIRLLKEGNI
jgi:ribosomal protein L37AE/L43A